MNNKLKLTKIINSWLDYLKLDNFSRAEVNVASDDNIMFDKGISLIGDNLLIEEGVFKQFKQKFTALDKKGKADDFILCVTFPIIWRVIEGNRRFYPLFQIDISTIFSGNYHGKGWDLNDFNFQPIIPNLMEFYGLDEEEVENLVTGEGIKVFLQTTFKTNFNTFQDFVDLVDVPDKPYTTKRNPYLLNFEYIAVSHNLKKDLQALLEQQQPVWMQTGHPAYEYLFGTPAEPNHEVLFLGAFPTHSPTDSQATALKHSLVNPLTAVVGPPGNGKTTFSLHQIAQQVVKRAVNLLQTGEDATNLTLTTSTNNRAVVNVEERLAQDFPTLHFCLSGGSKELITKQVLPKLIAAVDWLQREQFDTDKLEHLKTQLTNAVNFMQELASQDQVARLSQREFQSLLKQLETDIKTLDKEIDAIRQQQLQVPDYSQYPLSAYKIIFQYLSSSVIALPTNNQNCCTNPKWWIRLLRWFTRLWRSITKTNSKNILKRLHASIQTPVLVTCATPWSFRIPLTRESLIAAIFDVKTQIEAVEQWNRRSHYLVEGEIRLQEYKSRIIAIETELLPVESNDFYSRFYTEHHQLQVQIFELSWQYLQLVSLQRKDEIIESIKTYIGYLNNDWDAKRNLERNSHTIYRDVSLLFPVFTSTLHSIRNLFPFQDSGCIDQLIVDEAGMAQLHLVFPALARCNKALIIGDIKQLEPVMNLSQTTLEQYCKQAFNARGLSEEDYDRYSPTAISTATAYHRAAGASPNNLHLGNGIMLKEHQRCVEPIITFCDRICNYGLIIKTPNKPSLLGANLIGYHVDGKYDSHTNPEEIAAIARIIKELLNIGYKLDHQHNDKTDKTIGVISPYKKQANALKSHLQETWKHFPSNSIGTVHTFQGGEKSVIILSTRQCRKEDSLWFLNRRPNLLNVAVSRAKELFILVGNLDHLEQAGEYTKTLVEHIRINGEIRTLP